MKTKAKKVSNKVLLSITDNFRCPVYRNTTSGLVGPLTRSFRTGDSLKARKLDEVHGQLHVDLGKGYLAFNIPTDSVYIGR